MADGATRGPASQAVADSRRLAQTAEEAGERARAEEQRSSAAAGIDGVHKRRVAAGGGMVEFVDGHASDDVGGSSRVEPQINLLSASLSSSWARSTAARPRSPVRRKRRMQPSQPRPRCTERERGRGRESACAAAVAPRDPRCQARPGHLPTHPLRAGGQAGGGGQGSVCAVLHTYRL